MYQVSRLVNKQISPGGRGGEGGERERERGYYSVFDVHIASCPHCRAVAVTVHTLATLCPLPLCTAGPFPTPGAVDDRAGWHVGRRNPVTSGA